MSKRRTSKDGIGATEKRTLKRQRQREAGFKRKGGKGQTAQMSHASSSAAKKKAREGEEKMG